MTTLRRIGLCAGIAGCVSALLSAGPQPALSTEQKLRAELAQLKAQQFQCVSTLQAREARLKSIELSVEQATLVEEFRKALQATATDVFNWTSLTFEPAKTEASTPKGDTQ